MASPGLVLALGSIGVGVLLLSWHVAGIVLADRGDAARSDIYETARRGRLRKASLAYRSFEPLVDDFASAIVRKPSGRLAKTESALNVTLDDVGWTAAEWLADRQVAAALWAVLLGLPLAWVASGALGAFAVPFGTAAVYILRTQRAYGALDDRAEAARGIVGRSLPFAIDLIVLMLRAGSPLFEAIGALARQDPPTVWTRHLRLLLSDVDGGLTAGVAYSRFRARIGVDDVDTFISSLRQAGNVGMKLVNELASQAQQIRDRRSQALERQAEQAKNRLVLPALCSLAACMITMMAPLVISVFKQLAATFG